MKDENSNSTNIITGCAILIMVAILFAVNDGGNNKSSSVENTSPITQSTNNEPVSTDTANDNMKKQMSESSFYDGSSTQKPVLTSQNKITKDEPVVDSNVSSVSTEDRMALEAAQQYLDTMPFSRKGLYEQLTSDAGEGFSDEAAQYAIENVQTDYKQNAVEAAEQYLDSMPMSEDELYDQLTSDAGEGYTAEEASYAVATVYQ